MIMRYVTHIYYKSFLSYKNVERKGCANIPKQINFIYLLQNFKHLLKTLNTCMLWSASNRKVVMGLYDAYKQAQVRKRSGL